MEPVSIGILIVETLLKYGPTIATDVAKLLHGDEPTLADWLAVLDRASGHVNPDGTITLTPNQPAASAV